MPKIINGQFNRREILFRLKTQKANNKEVLESFLEEENSTEKAFYTEMYKEILKY